ncbi:restriction endonuclease subunit M, partial [bacterium]|nr:restriction endonuclease subunit M [bacterium]
IDRYMIRSFKGQIDKKDIPKEQSYINNNSVLVQNLVAHIENPIDHIKIICTIPQDVQCVIIDTINQITMDEDYPKEYIWILLNSNLINWYVYRFIYAKAIRTMHFDSPITSRIPIKKINFVIQHEFIQKADKMLELNKNLQETKQNFINELKLEKLTKKLQNFEELTFEEFVTEYTKALKLKFADKLHERSFKQEWQAIFENDKTLASGYKTEIEKTDKEIDKMVYELYGLSDEEIIIVEGA